MTGISDNGPVIVGVTWFLLLFCGAFLAVRLYAKVSRGEGFWWDDWILLFSWVFPQPCTPRVSVLTRPRPCCLSSPS